MQAIELGIPTEQTDADLPPIADVRINDVAPIMRVAKSVGTHLDGSPGDRTSPASRGNR